ncbi:hypothetical protein KR215_005822 [Drosophila sulfurigaster]|nr:hypothetical protein KR215_005822 [Drosophila sulfurigaster]
MENFVADAAEKMEAPRKRLGRPPKNNSSNQLAGAETPSNDELDAAATAADTSCRRSTRKKIAKFDVLDVLNKSRKTHKIQIEARIDSNTPTTSQNVATPTSTQGLSSPINRFIAARAAPQPTPTPSVPALELFTKPKPTPSLIVLQVSSDKSQDLPQRKRGRPRKQLSMDNTSSSSSSPQVEINAEIVTSLSGESSDSDLGVVTSNVPANLELQDDNALEPSQASNDAETEIITVLQSDEEDSDSQIIFVEIETATSATGEEQEDSNNPAEQHSFKLIFPKGENAEEEVKATPNDSNPSDQEFIAAVEEQLAKDEEEEQPGTELELITEELSEQASVCEIEEEVLLLEQAEQLIEETQAEEDENMDTVEDAKVKSVEDVKMETEVETKQEIVDEEKKEKVNEDMETADVAKQETDDLKLEKVDEANQETADEANQETIDDVNLKATDKTKPETTFNVDEPKQDLIVAAKLETVKDYVKLIADVITETTKDCPKEEVEEKQQPQEKKTQPSAAEKVIPIEVETKISEEILEQPEQKPTTETSKPKAVEQPKKDDVKVTSESAQTEFAAELPATAVEMKLSTEVTDKEIKMKATTKEPEVKQAKKEPPASEDTAIDTPPMRTEPSSGSKVEVMESRNTEKKKPTESPGPSPKREKSSTPAKLPIVECDALFKVLDEANAQMRQEEKTKKKLKQSAKKQKQETIKQSSPTPPTAATSRGKKSQSKKASRRNTISSEEQQQQQEKETPSVATNKRRNSLHPFKASPSPERRPESSGKKTKEKKPTRKSATAKETTETTVTKAEPSRRISTPTSEAEESFLLGDIAKFIEDGVKLLERDYRVEDEQQQQQQQPEEPEQQKQEEQQEDEFATRVANLETPATTPTPSPAVSTEDLSSGVRRSHRIKQKPQSSKSSQGRGSSAHTPSISMEQQLSELAHIEAINEQFLRHEGLNTFQTLRDNYYRCARQVSKENAEMQCDCFVTGDEEGLGQLPCGDGCINRMLMIECGPLCTNADRCTNKRFQQHQGWPCRVFRTEKKGCGITAELQIPPGEFIMEYVGEVIDSEEFERRQHLYSEDRNRHYYFMALRGEAIIDATSKGNISRYINHSCDPNAETQKWTVNGELRIGFFSVKTILPGEEITFDYQYQRYGRDAQRCYCESANCRGWIGNEPESDEGEQLDTDSESEQESLNEEPRLEQEQNKTKPSKGAKTKAQSKLPAAARKKRKEQPKAKDREYKAGRWLRPSGGSSGEKSASGKHDHVEDPDVLEQLTLLTRSGLKNQLDTLRFSRCMVRAKLLESRLQLLGVLTRGELPCRRLFLDYHGLRLLQAWISESGSDQQLRLALLDALESLPIPNKTMLNDSRVYQSVQLWSNQSGEPAQPDMERILALLQKWNGLPEIFRIPKRERIEQMKEHEREADRQQQDKPALEESNSAASVLSSDRYRQDRFRRDTTSRYEKSKPPSRMSGNNTICTITSTANSEGANGGGGGKSESRRRSEFDPRRAITKEMRRSLFERKVAQDEAEKRVGSEDFREHELRCEYFGADLNTDPKQLPFYQNTETNEWFNSDDQPVAAPLRCGDITEPPSPESPADVEYKLPPNIEPLPLSWTWARTPEGDIYYYHLRDREPQWEPPTAEQRLQKLVEDEPEPVPATETDDEANADHLIKVDIDFGAQLSAAAMDHLVEIKVRERREKRRNRLVSVRVISPRREEDRLYNQQESRKYKENKEKIRRRKEVYRRTRIETSATEADDEDQPADALPIHRYLYSSDEEATTDGDCLPEAEAEQEPGRSSETESMGSSKRKLPIPEGLKKHRSERDKKRKTASIAREASDKFHFEISAHVAEFLRPYRQETCQLGRITSDEDYKFLIKRLSHHITTKETRYCEATSNPLACTESVKHKSYDFIKQYMRKKGPIYKKPSDKMD